MSPILTFRDEIFPVNGEGTSTLDLSLSKVTIGSFLLIVSPGLTKISIISTLSKSPISGTIISVVIIDVFIYTTILSFFSHVNIDAIVMTLILQNIGKLF